MTAGKVWVVFSRKVANGQAAIEQLITLLLATGQPVVYVPGRLVNRMAGAFAGAGKTDARDSRTIAETARMRGALTPITSPDAVVTDLQVLTARREDLMAAYAGLAPVPRDSGRIRGNLHRPQRYHRGLRRVFSLAALTAIRQSDSPSRVFYLWALLRDRREFHPSPPVTATAAA